MWIDLKSLRWKKLYYTKCKKYKEFKKHKEFKISYICDKTFFQSSIFNKWEGEDGNIFTEEESIEILKILGLINNM